MRTLLRRKLLLLSTVIFVLLCTSLVVSGQFFTIPNNSAHLMKLSKTAIAPKAVAVEAVDPEPKYT